MGRNIDYDILVVGAGNAALSAAIVAAENGAKVLVLEKSPKTLRGGNTYFTGGLMRFSYNDISEIREIIPDISDKEAKSVDVGSYSEGNFYDDLMRVTEGMSDPDLAELLVSRSYSTMKWMTKNKMKWQLAYGRQSFLLNGKHNFWGGLTVEAAGGGKGMIDQLFAISESKGVNLMYEATATDLLIDKNGGVTGLQFTDSDGLHSVKAKAVILACGGFEADPAMRAQYLGPDWELVKVRGSRFNTGDGIKMARRHGAASHGHWSCCHAVAWDLNAPQFGDPLLTDLYQKHSYPLGIVVNSNGRRFLDEGADFRNYTYAKYGREIIKQPGRVAFQIFDSKMKGLLRSEYFIKKVTYSESDSIETVAKNLGINPANLIDTVDKFNSSVSDDDFDPTILDSKCTNGIEPRKSNWAVPLDTPPYLGFAVTCGITFTFGGLHINAKAQVLDTSGRPMPGLYAAGELVGGIFYHNYPGGSGLMAGAVFGKIAGESAAGSL